jgi:quercetin dioxygenase-like cupin family protein
VGLVAGIDQYGWAVDELFQINLADAPAIGAPRGATFIKLEPDGVTWSDTGVNVQVMQPGQPAGRYHSEPVQEDFLVLYGECIAIVDDGERALRQWDFLHCPAGSGHVFVGTGDGPCAVLMIGSRREDALRYTVKQDGCPVWRVGHERDRRPVGG